MTEHDRFDMDLAVAMRAYSNHANSLVDAGAFVHAIALRYPRRHGIAGLFMARPVLVWLLLAALLAVSISAAAALVLRPKVLGGGGLIAFSRDGDVYLAAPDGGDAVLALDLDIDVDVVDWSPDGRHLLLSAADEAYLLDPGTLDVRPLGNDNSTGALSWTSDGSVLVKEYPGAEIGIGECCAFAIVDVDDGATRKVGPPAGISNRFCLPVLSPDGEWIAAINGDLVVIDLSSGDWSPIAKSNGYGCGYWKGWGFDAPTWSPDSSQLAFVSSGSADPPEPWTISIVNRDGSNEHQVVTNASEMARPLWSPDGQLIAYRSGSGLAVVHPDGTGHRQLSDINFDSERVQWTEDSKRIDFPRSLGDSDDLGGDEERFEWWTVDVASGQSEAISVASPDADTLDRQPMYDDRTAPPFPPVLPAPRGDPLQPRTPASGGEPADPSLVASGLAFDEERPESCEARIVWFNGTSETHLPDACSYEAGGAWSPTGLWYARLDAAYGVVGRGAIQLTNRDGTESRTLEALGSGNEFHWSPNGNWLALQQCPRTFAGCTSSLPDVTSPWGITDLNGSEGGDVPSQPLWSADDSILAVVSSQGALLMGDGHGRALLTGPIARHGTPLTWSPDSSQLAFLEDGDVWVTDTFGSTARNLTMFGPAASASFASWSPDGALVAVIHGNAVWLIPADGGELQRLEFEGILPNKVVWSPDGGRIAVETRDRVILVEVDDPRPVLLTDAAKAVWSPDGTMLALDSRGLDGSGHIDVVRADGSGRREIAQAVDGFSPLVWINPD